MALRTNESGFLCGWRSCAGHSWRRSCIVRGLTSPQDALDSIQNESLEPSGGSLRSAAFVPECIEAGREGICGDAGFFRGIPMELPGAGGERRSSRARLGNPLAPSGHPSIQEDSSWPQEPSSGLREVALFSVSGRTINPAIFTERENGPTPDFLIAFPVMMGPPKRARCGICIGGNAHIKVEAPGYTYTGRLSGKS